MGFGTTFHSLKKDPFWHRFTSNIDTRLEASEHRGGTPDQTENIAACSKRLWAFPRNVDKRETLVHNMEGELNDGKEVSNPPARISLNDPG
jgi:hypothetical protein